MAEPDELALHPPVSPRRIVLRHADYELADRSRRGRPSGAPTARVIPLACHQAPVPGQERRRGHREHLAPPPPGDQPGQRREPQPVTRLVTDPADLAPQHRVLVPEHQELGILGHLTPGQHRQTAEQTANEQVDDREEHSAMIPTRLPAQAGSSNRAPHAQLCRCTPPASSTSQTSIDRRPRTQSGTRSAAFRAPGRYHHGVPGAGLRILHSPEELPVERVNVQARRGGTSLGLSVKPFVPPLGVDVNEVHFTANRPVAALEPRHIGIDHSVLITTHTATVEVVLKPWRGRPIGGM